MAIRKSLSDIVNISIPAILEVVVYSVISMIDVMFIGKFGGSKAVSAIGLANEVWNTFVNVFIVFGISIAITSFVARTSGAKNQEESDEYSRAGMFIGTIVSLIITYILFTFSSSILKMGGQKGSVLILGTEYMRVSVFGIFFNMINSLLSSIFRGYGDTYTPFVCSCILFLLNVILDYIFIRSIGVIGVAIAKDAAYIGEFILIVLFTVRRGLFKINIRKTYILKRIKNIVRLSIPASLEEGAFSVSRLLSSFILMEAGTISYAANQIANTIESISFMPIVGLGIATTTLVGTKIGQGKIKLAEKYSRICALAGVGIMFLFSILFFCIPTILVGYFVDAKECALIASSSMCLKIGAIEQPFFAVSIVFASALKGAGNTKDPFYISLFTSWAIRIPLIYYFISLKKCAVTTVWWITGFQWGIDALITYMVFCKNFKRFRRN